MCRKCLRSFDKQMKSAGGQVDNVVNIDNVENMFHADYPVIIYSRGHTFCAACLGPSDFLLLMLKIF